MQTAEAILQAMHNLGEERKPLTRVYRSLFSEDLFLLAYDRIGRNKGSLTPGTANDTADGTSLADIRSSIDKLRHERFRFRPSRRTRIPKKKGGKRPLGVPDFPEKLVQEALRLLLEAYYEPRFRDCSHGFRPERGCHTALTFIKNKFKGTAWFIEGDIRGCFDNIDHEVLMGILSRDIKDGRLLNLIRMCLEAGYVEDWEYHKTHSGTPQGGIISPLLANIYLHELDRFVEDVLIPRYTRGDRRANNLKYYRLMYAIKRARELGDEEMVRQLEQQRRELPSQDMNDPGFRRLRYCRYADDFILGFMGPKAEAEEIKQAISTFLKDRLHLELNEAKTLITHARTEHARFLNYDISVYHADDKISPRAGTKIKTRSINGVIRLGIPYGLVDEKMKPYMKNGKPASQPGMLFQSDAETIDTFQTRFRGIAEYYKYATDRNHLGKLKYAMEISLTKTLAQKFKITVSGVYRKYRGTQTVDGYTYKTLQVEVPTKRATRVIYWGAISLKTVKPGSEPIDDVLPKSRAYTRTDLVQRLQANKCELCGSEEQCEVHHVRKLADLKKRWQGRKEKPAWVQHMIARHRKTLVVCKLCHHDIHAGRPTPKTRI